MNQINRACTHVRIPSHLNGPPELGNGGIICALLADRCGDSFEAELRAPAPLERDLEIVSGDAGDFELRDGENLIARGRPRALELKVPRAPDWGETQRAHAHALTLEHPFPHCFVCGPARAEGDGLRVITGPVKTRPGLVAAPWRPHTCFADEGGEIIESRFVWAALDCPGGIAALEGKARPILLARFHGRIDRRPAAGERCMVIGWVISHDGRKHVAGSAIIDEAGLVLGCAESLWIEPRKSSHPG